MDIISYSEARSNFKDIMNRACEDHQPIAITRQGGEPVVLLSLADYNALNTTAYLLRSEANRQRLQDAVQEARQGINLIVQTLSK